MKNRNSKTAYLLIAPAFILFGIFSLYPLLWSLNISLTSWDGLNAIKEYVGFNNYTYLFRDHEFLSSLRTTFIYVTSVTAISTVLGFWIALMLQSKKSAPVYRTLFFTPVVTATVAAGIVWQLIFDPFAGILDKGLRAVGIMGPNWLSDSKYALPAVIIVGIWKRMGFAMVIFAAGLSALPVSTFEAAAIDGATGWKAVRHMTIPLMKPITTVVLVTGVIDAIQVFDHIFVMTNGGPLGSTNVISLYLYNQGFHVFHLGLASAVGWILFALIFVVTVFQWQLRKQSE
jgi:multiple sugar transport system permease protein